MANLHVEITDGEIPLAPTEAWIECVSAPDNGAISWFYGVTRRTTGGQVTEYLDYAAHPTMAGKQLRCIAETAADRFGLSGVVIVHRTGKVSVGRASIVVGCGSSHRKESFAAVAWIMDRIKADVPIWKRDHFVEASGESDAKWVHPGVSQTSGQQIGTKNQHA